MATGNSNPPGHNGSQLPFNQLNDEEFDLPEARTLGYRRKQRVELPKLHVVPEKKHDNPDADSSTPKKMIVCPMCSGGRFLASVVRNPHWNICGNCKGKGLVSDDNPWITYMKNNTYFNANRGCKMRVFMCRGCKKPYVKEVVDRREGLMPLKNSTDKVPGLTQKLRREVEADAQWWKEEGKRGAGASGDPDPGDKSLCTKPGPEVEVIGTSVGVPKTLQPHKLVTPKALATAVGLARAGLNEIVKSPPKGLRAGASWEFPGLFATWGIERQKLTQRVASGLESLHLDIERARNSGAPTTHLVEPIRQLQWMLMDPQRASSLDMLTAMWTEAVRRVTLLVPIQQVQQWWLTALETPAVVYQRRKDELEMAAAAAKLASPPKGTPQAEGVTPEKKTPPPKLVTPKKKTPPAVRNLTVELGIPVEVPEKVEKKGRKSAEKTNDGQPDNKRSRSTSSKRSKSSKKDVPPPPPPPKGSPSGEDRG